MQKREYEFDYMRIICAFCVIMIHVCAMEWKTIDVHDNQWIPLTVYNMGVRFCVPVFFMISGRFMLDENRKVESKDIFRKCKKLIMLYIFWSFVYTLRNIERVIVGGYNIREELKWIIVEFFGGEYHMWFIYAILGLYLVTPILRIIVTKKDILVLYITLFVIFATIMPTIISFPKIGIIASQIDTEMKISVVLGYGGYYVLGYYLHKYPIDGIKRKVVYLFGLLGVIVSVGGTCFISLKAGVASEEMIKEYLTFYVCCSSVAVYILLLNICKNEKPHNWINLFAKYSLGCYLVHPLIIGIFERIGIVPTIGQTVFTVPLITGATYILSLIFCMILSKIPVLKKVIQ